MALRSVAASVFLALNLALFAFRMAEGAGITGKLRTANDRGGKGSYYLPGGYSSRRLPLALLLHGSGQRGEKMVQAFQQLAEANKFIIVAPDSNDMIGWMPGSDKERGGDMAHIMACLQEARRLAGVRVNPARILVGGHSAGAQMSPYVGFSHKEFSAVAILHGRVSPPDKSYYNVINMPNVWFSCGAKDTLCDYAVSTAALKKYCNFPSLTIFPKAKYPGGHSMSNQEKADMIKWWLKGAGSTPRQAGSGSPGIPLLPATTASARSLQQRLALGTFYAAIVKKDGSPVGLAIPGRNCSYYRVTNCPVCSDTCAVPQFATKTAVAVGASPTTGDHRYLALSKGQGTVEYLFEDGSGCGLRCSQITSKGCVRNIKAIYEGYTRSLAIFRDGSIKCYLSGIFGAAYPQHCTTMPRALTKAATASAGPYHSLAATPEGKVYAWGCESSSPGPCKVPADLGKAVAVAAGDGFSMALLADGSVRAWPASIEGYSVPTVAAMPGAVSTPPPTNRVVAIAATENAFALLADGMLWAWGPDYGTAAADAAGAKVLLSNIISMQVQYSTGESTDRQHLWEKSLLFVRPDGSLWFANLPNPRQQPPTTQLHNMVRLARAGTML